MKAKTPLSQRIPLAVVLIAVILGGLLAGGGVLLAGASWMPSYGPLVGIAVGLVLVFLGAGFGLSA